MKEVKKKKTSSKEKSVNKDLEKKETTSSKKKSDNTAISKKRTTTNNKTSVSKKRSVKKDKIEKVKGSNLEKKETTTSKKKSDNTAISKKRTTTNNKTSVSKKHSIEKDRIEKVEGPNLEEIGYSLKNDKSKHHRSCINIIVLIIILVLLIVVFIGLHVITPSIDLNGDSVVEISYNDKYVEKGATAKFFNDDLSKKIKIYNNVNTSKIGNYEVVYIIKHSFYEIKKVRVVRVIDNKEPIISLDGKEEVYVCPNSKFKEIGYKALDEYDGDITEKVKITEDKDKIIYSVKDSSGNSYSISRKINYKDIEKPVITLKGNSTMYIGLDGVFTEPGYTVNDNCSGDLTNKVIVSGSVSNGVEGVYTITYEVADNSNNKTVIKRKVIVSERTNPNSGVVRNGVIYLTFDDGPSNVITGAILDVLKEEGVKATFFVTNNGPDYLIKRIYDEGHTIGLHTASHDYSKIYSSVDNYFADLKSVSDRVKRITGQTSKIVRFPGGSSNTVSRKYSYGIMTKLSEELFNRGYRYYDWNVDSKDASTSKTSNDVYKSVISNLSKNKANIVLMHDIKVPTRNAIRSIIKYGKENGYTFDRIDMDTYMVRQKINN